MRAKEKHREVSFSLQGPLPIMESARREIEQPEFLCGSATKAICTSRATALDVDKGSLKA